VILNAGKKRQKTLKTFLTFSFHFHFTFTFRFFRPPVILCCFANSSSPSPRVKEPKTFPSVFGREALEASCHGRLDS